MAWESGVSGGWSVSPSLNPNVMDWTLGFVGASANPDPQLPAAVGQEHYFNFFVVEAPVVISSIFNPLDRKDGDGYIRVPTRIRRL